MWVLQKYSVNRKKWFVLTAVLLLILSTQASYARTTNIFPELVASSNDSFIVKTHKVNINIFSVSNVSVTEIFDIENNQNVSVTSVDLWINQSCSNINVRDGLGDLVFDTPIRTYFYQLLSIQLRTSLLSNRSTTIYINYDLAGSIYSHKNPNHLRFEFFSTITYETNNHDFTIKLPKKSFVLASEDIVDIIYPAGFFQFIVGQRIAISWSNTDLEPNENPYYRVRFEEQKRNTLAIVFSIIGPILGLSIGIIFTLWIMRRRERKTVKEIGTIFLNESQKMLLKNIYESGGKILQRELAKKTGFTRSKTSRNLISLEQHGMIKRERWGRNTIIRITKTGEKVIE
jgi:uncharacterized membrane protein